MVSPTAKTLPPAAHLRPARSSKDRPAATEVAGPPAPSLQPGGPPSRLPLRHLRLAGRVLPHPRPRPAPGRTGLLRGGDTRHIDIGRPDRVSLIFDRRVQTRRHRPTPSQFRTRVFTVGVTPSLHIEYKTTRVKQYHKESIAFRTETTINDSRHDFGIGKRLCNLPALREVGFSANRRLLHVQHIGHDPLAGQAVFDSIARPIIVNNQRAPALRFGDPRVHALLSAVVVYRYQPDGFASRHLRTHLAELLAVPPSTSPPGVSATTYAASDSTASSNASHTPTATGPPRWDGAPPCSSPMPTTASSSQASPKPPTSPTAAPFSVNSTGSLYAQA
jgi:hypothetical protein